MALTSINQPLYSIKSINAHSLLLSIQLLEATVTLSEEREENVETELKFLSIMPTSWLQFIQNPTAMKKLKVNNVNCTLMINIKNKNISFLVSSLLTPNL